MKELDFHTFSHNDETYFVIMIANLSNDIHKLDLGLQIIRKLMDSIGNLPEFPWVVKDITHSLTELSQIIQKNYFLRDAYYNMELDIQKTLSGYHIILRDYQYDIEKKINEIIDKIQNTMKTTVETSKKDLDYQFILEKYQDKKILPIVVRFVDVAQSKKWEVDWDEKSGDWVITRKVQEIGRVKIQQKKAIITIPANELTLTLTIGQEIANKKNLELIKSL